MKIRIQDYYDGFDIIVDGKRFHFDQEDTREGLVEVFQKLGREDDEIEYEEVY